MAENMPGATPALPQYSSGYTPKAPGPKNPQNYPYTGPNYDLWGEQAGYIYNPWTDRYDRDPKAYQEYQDRFGLTPPVPKEPSMMDTYGPIVGGAAAITLGQQLIKDPSSLVPNIGNIFGGGSAGAEAAGTAAGTAQAAEMGSAGSAINAGGLATNAANTSGASTSPGFLGSIWGSGGAPEVAGQGWLGGGGALGTAAGVAAGGLTGLEQIKGLEGMLHGDRLSNTEAAALALPTFGASLLYNPVRSFFDKDKWKTEGNRLGELADQGVYIPQNLLDSRPTGGRSTDEMQRKDLADDYIGRDAAGNCVNNKFNQSRDIKDSRPEDWVNYAVWAEHDPTWYSKPLDERLKIVDGYLQSGALKEHHGSLDVDFEKGPKEQKPAVQAPFQVNSQGQIVKQPTPGKYPPKGTRLSPGIYADGMGGSYRA